MTDIQTSRRSFLKTSAVATGGLLMAVNLPGTLGQAMAFAEQAEELVTSGRQPCRLCGRPMEPGGHACPRWN